MNGNWLSEAELDLLADFTAGVLDPDQYERVARLVGTDDRWATAHQDLVEADRAVRSDLRAIGGPIAMPPYLVARLDATIAGLADPVRSPARPVRSPARGADAQRRRSRPDQPSRWRRAGLAVVGVAAAAVLLGWGVPTVLHGLSRQFTGDAQTTSGDVAAGAPAAPVLPGGPPTIRSGRDYQPGTLGQLSRSFRGAATKATPTPAPAAAAPGSGSTGSNDSAQAPTLTELSKLPLSRLANPDALQACLAAVGQTHPGTPSLIDFAEFDGAPALVIVVQQPTGELAVVVGPACGVGGPDERYSATIGP